LGSWKKASILAAISRGSLRFEVFDGSIKLNRLCRFLARLQGKHRGRILVILDNLGLHHAKDLKAWLADQGGRIHLEYLPAYAPEPNPSEYVFGHTKQHGLRNYAPSSHDELKGRGRCHLQHIQKRPGLITSFWKKAGLKLT
jgi:transposase